MKRYAVLLLALWAALAEAEEFNLATMTVGEVQRIYHAEADGSADSKGVVQKAFQAFFNGYIIGYAHGIAHGLLQAGVVTNDVSPRLADCVPNSRQTFYLMLAATGPRANLNVPQFAGRVIREQCRDTITDLGKSHGSR